MIQLSLEKKITMRNETIDNNKMMNVIRAKLWKLIFLIELPAAVRKSQELRHKSLFFLS